MKSDSIISYLIGAHQLLSRKHRRQFLVLQAIFLLSAIMQVFGIASIAPFIAVISNPSLIESNVLLAEFNRLLGAPELDDFLKYYALTVGLMILISNLFAATALWFLFRFSMSAGAELKVRLFRSYMAAQYVFFSQHNSAGLITNITDYIPRYTYMILQPLLYLGVHTFIAAIIIVGLIALDPLLAIISIVIVAGIYWLIYVTVNTGIRNSGHVVSFVAKRIIMLMNESVGGIKEVKLLGLEQRYEKEMDKTVRKGLNALAFISLAGDLPKYIVETIVFCAILLLALYLLGVYGSDGEAISILSIYAMAGYKILPAVQGMYKSITDIRANGSLIAELHETMDDAASHASRNIDVVEKSHLGSSNFEIKIEDVYYKFPGQSSYALDGITFNVPEYSLTALVGASGAGKSTCADIILGLITPERGKIQVGDVEIGPHNVRAWQKNIGFVPQNIFLLDDTVSNNIAFGVPDELIDQKRVREAARRANILEFIESDPAGFQLRVGERGAKMSGGQRQRIGIARALYNNPSVLVLDEATSALDNITEGQVLEELASLAKSTTLIMIAHRMSTVRKADHVVYFEKGRATGSGTYESLSSTHSGFQELLKGKSPKR